MVLSVNPVASGIAVQPLARETEKLLAKADNIGATFMAGPRRTRNAWTKLVVHSVPSRTSELLSNSVCEREFPEEELALQMKEAFGVQPVRCFWSTNLGQKPGLQAALVSFGQDDLGRIPPAIRVNGARLTVDVRKGAPKPARRRYGPPFARFPPAWTYCLIRKR